MSARSRYAPRVLLDITEHSCGKNIPMKEVTKRESLSLKYLEQILPVPTKHNMIEDVHGKDEGYRVLTVLPYNIRQMKYCA